jgi:protein phosphatase
MPWSAKAQELLKSQYAAVGASANAALPNVIRSLQTTRTRISGEAAPALDGLLADFQRRQRSSERFIEAYRHYCWPVEEIIDFKLAPFHLLATEAAVHFQRNHQWHMETLADICREDEQLLLATPYRVVDASDPEQTGAATHWWRQLTESGGEGMVVKPLDIIAWGKKGLVQPALKCRGKEYLRIIYGPDYTDGENLQRLRQRGLASKRSLALREFALGVEALERFIRREPLRRVHECVFSVLALESEPVDPRL